MQHKLSILYGADLHSCRRLSPMADLKKLWALLHHLTNHLPATSTIQPL